MYSSIKMEEIDARVTHKILMNAQDFLANLDTSHELKVGARGEEDARLGDLQAIQDKCFRERLGREEAALRALEQELRGMDDKNGAYQYTKQKAEEAEEFIKGMAFEHRAHKLEMIKSTEQWKIIQDEIHAGPRKFVVAQIRVSDIPLRLGHTTHSQTHIYITRQTDS
jgi:hypothetical protein